MVFFEQHSNITEKQVLYLTGLIEIIKGFVNCANFFFWDHLYHYYWKFYKLNVTINNNKK